MKGIVWDGEELVVRDSVEVRDPDPDEVLVRIVNSGVCHSDVAVVDGTIPFLTPVVLGHEGAGIVERLGSAVTDVAPGDHVVLSALGNCGSCPECDTGRPTMCRATFGHFPRPFTCDGVEHFSFANVSSFAEYTVVKARQAVPIPAEIPLASASLIGCAVVTGAGAVLHRARVAVGDPVVVVGVGGIGLNAIQAAALSGAHPIVAIDTNPGKEEVARRFGATEFIDPAAVGDTVEAVEDLTGGGATFVFECVGAKALIEQAIAMLAWNGTVVILGVTPFGTPVEFTPESLYHDKTIMGCRYGSSRPHRDIPMYVDLYLAGEVQAGRAGHARLPDGRHPPPDRRHARRRPGQRCPADIGRLTIPSSWPSNRSNPSAQTSHHVVEAGRQGFDVGGLDRGEHADTELVASELAVALRVDDAVRPQHRGDGVGRH